MLDNTIDRILSFHPTTKDDFKLLTRTKKKKKQNNTSHQLKKRK
jgi:hypothetical protein